MKKIIGLLVLCVVLLTACNQEKKVMKQASYGNFVVESPTSRTELQVLMGKHKVVAREHKEYAWYNDKKIHYTTGGFSGRLLHGNFIQYFGNGNLKTKGTYKKGLKEGVWRAFYLNGKLQSSLKYSKGDTASVVKVFKEDGSYSELLCAKDIEKKAKCAKWFSWGKCKSKCKRSCKRKPVCGLQPLVKDTVGGENPKVVKP